MRIIQTYSQTVCQRRSDYRLFISLPKRVEPHAFYHHAVQSHYIRITAVHTFDPGYNFSIAVRHESFFLERHAYFIDISGTCERSEENTVCNEYLSTRRVNFYIGSKGAHLHHIQPPEPGKNRKDDEHGKYGHRHPGHGHPGYYAHGRRFFPGSKIPAGYKRRKEHFREFIFL